MQQFSLDLQQADYAQVHVRHRIFRRPWYTLLGALNINEPKPGTWGVVTPTTVSSGCAVGGVPAMTSSTCDRVLNQIVPYLGYQAIDALRTIFNSNYNSLQVKATKRFSGKTYVDANYTWSRDLTRRPPWADYPGLSRTSTTSTATTAVPALDRNQVLSFDGVFEEPFFRDQKDLKGRLLGGWDFPSSYSANNRACPLTVSPAAVRRSSYTIRPGGVRASITMPPTAVSCNR